MASWYRPFSQNCVYLQRVARFQDSTNPSQCGRMVKTFVTENIEHHSLTIVIIFYNFSQKDYICYDIVPRHHNVIRYRKGLAMIKDDFHTVCSWTQFPAKNAWKYDLFLGMKFVDGVGNWIFLIILIRRFGAARVYLQNECVILSCVCAS